MTPQEAEIEKLLTLLEEKCKALPVKNYILHKGTSWENALPDLTFSTIQHYIGKIRLALKERANLQDGFYRAG